MCLQREKGRRTYVQGHHQLPLLPGEPLAVCRLRQGSAEERPDLGTCIAAGIVVLATLASPSVMYATDEFDITHPSGGFIEEASYCKHTARVLLKVRYEVGGETYYVRDVVTGPMSAEDAKPVLADLRKRYKERWTGAVRYNHNAPKEATLHARELSPHMGRIVAFGVMLLALGVYLLLLVIFTRSK